MSFTVERLRAADFGRMRALNALFAAEFDDPKAYESAPPSDEYLQRTLGRGQVIVLVASAGVQVIGGLVAYLIDKLEQERSEIYVYDLAVSSAHRRRGVASALIAQLQAIAASADAWAICVQADSGDEAAIALYDKFGTREEVLHFDIAPAPTR